MKRTLAGLAAGCCAVALAGTLTWAMGGNHRPGQPVGGNDRWPKGLAELINHKARLGGFFVNADDFFYFRGDARTFNAFLRAYAAIKGPKHRITLHPGRGINRRPWGNENPKPVDWRVDVINRAWRGAGKGYDVLVHLWLGGNVPLDELEVPLTVDVESGREIEKFVADHQAKQSLERAPASGKEASPPAKKPAAAAEQ